VKSILKEKSYAFALRIVKLYKYLCSDKKEYVISKQVLRSGTAIGALVQGSLKFQTVSGKYPKCQTVSGILGWFHLQGKGENP